MQGCLHIHAESLGAATDALFCPMCQHSLRVNEQGVYQPTGILWRFASDISVQIDLAQLADKTVITMSSVFGIPKHLWERRNG